MQDIETMKRALANGLLSRRELLERTGMGLGALALGQLFEGSPAAPGGRKAAPAESPATRPIRWPPGPPFSGQGQARHPSVHERRAVAGRYVRPQADADQVRTARRCRIATCRPNARPARRCPRRSSSRNTARAGIEVSDIFPQHRLAASTTLRSSARCTPTCRTTSRRCLLMNCGEARLVAPQHGLVADLWPGDRKPEPARLHRHVPGGYPIQERRTGRPAFCRASIRAPTSTRQHADRRS